MTADEIRKGKDAVEAEDGPWSAYNIGLATGSKQPHSARARTCAYEEWRTVADLSLKPWAELRILDLASLEGIFALEFASHGAQVIAIEGREANNARARFAAKALGLSNVEFVTDDVRNLSEKKYGRFDVVLCSGMLYHLPGEDGCQFIRSIAEVCARLAIIDTHVGLRDDSSISWSGHAIMGRCFRNIRPQILLLPRWAARVHR